MNLRRIAEESADEWVQRALAKDIDFGFELADAEITGEEFLLREAYGNLAHNALEYTLRGGHVTVRAGLRNARPILEIEDDGPGIPPDIAARLFEPQPLAADGRLGIGLAVAKQLAERFSGTLAYTPRPGGGGVPTAGADAQADSAPEVLTAPSGGRGREPRGPGCVSARLRRTGATRSANC